MTETLQRIAIDELMPDPSQPRKTFIREEIERLAASIGARGILLPLRVLRDEERQCWRIITPVLSRWAEGGSPLDEYEAGSAGPEGW